MMWRCGKAVTDVNMWTGCMYVVEMWTGCGKIVNMWTGCMHDVEMRKGCHRCEHVDRLYV